MLIADFILPCAYFIVHHWGCDILSKFCSLTGQKVDTPDAVTYLIWRSIFESYECDLGVAPRTNIKKDMCLI